MDSVRNTGLISKFDVKCILNKKNRGPWFGVINLLFSL